MKKKGLGFYIVGLFVIFSIFFLILRLFRIKTLSSESFINYNTPKLIHLIYIPWDQKQKLKDDYMDFDKTAYEQLKKENPDYEIKLWLLPDIKNFVREFYIDYYDIIFSVPRPVMIVDILRLLIIYHYGGIYWQYGSQRKCSMDNFLPSKNKKVKLFVEKIITTEFANSMKNEPIRNGEPEELIRVCNQIFSAESKNSYIFEIFKVAIENCKKYQVMKDYDILYITGNAMMSMVYDKIGKNNTEVELIENTLDIVQLSYNGSWRMD